MKTTGTGRIGAFILRIIPAVAWFAVAYLVAFRIVEVPAIPMLKNILAGFSVSMGIISLLAAVRLPPKRGDAPQDVPHDNPKD